MKRPQTKFYANHERPPKLLG